MKIGRIDIAAGSLGYMRVSKPGVEVRDVEDSNDPDLLFSTTRVPTNIVMSGRVYCPSGTPVVAVYPYEVPARPIVDVQTSFSTNTVRLPYFNLSGVYVRVTIEPTLTQVTFTCDSNRYVNYVVVARNG